MENEVMDTMTEVIDIDKAEEVLELVVMSDYSKGFIHGGVAVGGALAVKKTDYPLYEEIFRLTYPTADPTGWLQEYFEEKAEKEYFTVPHAGHAQSSTLAPVMYWNNVYNFIKKHTSI